MKRLLSVAAVLWGASNALAQATPETVPAAPALPAERALDSAAGPAEMSAVELEALGFGGPDSSAPAVDTDLHLFGFIDFGTSAALPKSGDWSGALGGRHRSFSVGNFNLYLSKNISEKVRTMGEVRLLYLPNGSTDPANAYIDTSVGDYNDFGRLLHWGGIEIERVYLEWSALRYLTIRAGQFLTPYGIWNVDHGSPTYIPVRRPFIIGAGWFPQRQTGFELFGRWDASLHSSIGYHATLSNGQGLTSEYHDFDDNKAVGGRVYVEHRRLGDLRIGFSGFYGKTTDATPATTFVDGKLRFGESVRAQYKSLSLAADILWKYKGLQMQAEWIGQQVVFTEAGRTQLQAATTGQPAYPRDGLSWGIYFLAGYRFRWYGVMPYTVVQYLDQTDNLTARVNKLAVWELGLNIRPIDAVVLKGSYSYARLPDGAPFTKDPLHFIQAQVAWAF